MQRATRLIMSKIYISTLRPNKNRRLPYAELIKDVALYPVSTNRERGERLGQLGADIIFYMLKRLNMKSQASVGRPLKLTEEQVKKYVMQNPYFKLFDMSKYFNCSMTACWNALKRNGIVKKYTEIQEKE